MGSDGYIARAKRAIVVRVPRHVCVDKI